MVKKILVIVGLATVILFYIPPLVLPGDRVVTITAEDHFYENWSAIFFFLASIGYLYTFFRVKNRNYFYLLFALMFFFAAGEEISWGQRILHFPVPAFFASNNSQGEFNIHNLAPLQHETGMSWTIKSLLNFNRLFIVFWVGYAVLVPLADMYISRLRDLFAKIRLPIVSLWFGLMFLVCDAGCLVVEQFVKGKIPIVEKIAEIKESLWATIVFLMVFYFLFVFQRRFSFQRQKATEMERAAVP